MLPEKLDTCPGVQDRQPNEPPLVQGSAGRWALGCVNSPPAARGSQEGGITQPGAHLLAVPCMPDRLLATNSNCRNCDFQLERVTCHRFYRRVSNLVYSSGSAATATGDRPTSKKAFFAPANYVFSLGSLPPFFHCYGWRGGRGHVAESSDIHLFFWLPSLCRRHSRPPMGRRPAAVLLSPPPEEAKGHYNYSGDLRRNDLSRVGWTPLTRSARSFAGDATVRSGPESEC